MPIKAKVDGVFQTSEDSWYIFDKVGNLKYRMPKKFIGFFNAAMTKIGKDAAKIASSYTPFQYFRNAWESKTSTSGRGMISMINISNKLVNSRMPYRSDWSDSGKTFYFPIKKAISMLEFGRKKYEISPRNKNKHGSLTIGPTDNDAGFSFIKKTVKIPATNTFRYQPVTNAMKYVKAEFSNYVKDLKLSGIRNAIPSQNFEFKKGNFAGSFTRNFRNGKLTPRGKKQSDEFKERKESRG